jgi:hypothetical protein
MADIEQRNIAHGFNDEELESVLVSDGSGQALPGVVIIPSVMGITDLEIGWARDLVGHGYNAFIADVFGKQFRGAARDVMFGEMNRIGGIAPRCATGCYPCFRWRGASPNWMQAASPSWVSVLAASAHSTWRGLAKTLRVSPASTASSIHRDCPPTRSVRRSFVTTAGTIRWFTLTPSSRWPRS